MSYDSFMLVSKLLHPHRFHALMNPVKDILVSADTMKVQARTSPGCNCTSLTRAQDVTKLQEILRNVAIGLNANAAVSEEDLLKFINGSVLTLKTVAHRH